MRFLALATDYDGTIAQHGDVNPSTCAALQRLKASGRKLILVTGRELHDLFRVFASTHLFDYIVAENGALLYHPGREHSKTLALSPPKSFVDLLRERGVHPLSVGRVIVATHENYKEVVQQAVDELHLDSQIILNKGDVMVLPRGVDKASGLKAALAELNISPSHVAGVGDAENDFALLSLCGFAVAVENALPSLKRRADLITKSSHGAGVEELIAHILASDPAHATA